MNVRTKDGVVHALKSVIADDKDCHSVLCGLKGQGHSEDRPGATAAMATMEPVTCLACMALEEGAARPWVIKGAGEPN